MKEPVRMVVVLLVLMVVLKRRLEERKRQHEGRQDGDERPHMIIFTYTILNGIPSELDLQVELHPARLRRDQRQRGDASDSRTASEHFRQRTGTDFSGLRYGRSLGRMILSSG
jgi:hypothetical protein